MLKFRRVLNISDDILPRIPPDRLIEGGTFLKNEKMRRDEQVFFVMLSEKEVGK